MIPLSGFQLHIDYIGHLVLHQDSLFPKQGKIIGGMYLDGLINQVIENGNIILFLIGCGSIFTIIEGHGEHD